MDSRRELRNKLKGCFRGREEGEAAEEYRARREDFAFHLSDFADDLQRLAQLYAKPSRSAKKEWNDAVSAFIYHVTGHLIAAADLYDEICDPFHVLERQGGGSGADKIRLGRLQKGGSKTGKRRRRT